MTPSHLRESVDEQVRELLAHGAVALADTDPEGVHRLRVAVRRLRAVLKVGAAPAGLDAELRWFFGELGPLRDLDVLLARLRADDFRAAERAALERLLSGLVTEREEARRRAVKALRGKRYARLLAALEAVAFPAPAGRAEVDLVAAIARPHRRLRAAVATMGPDPADEQLHDLRIRGKKLRYAAEPAAPAGGKPVRALVRATRHLQDVLGEFHDACVAERRVRALVGADPEEAFVAGRLVERERARQLAMRAEWRAAYTEVDRRAAALRG
jgi:CHAD domain-containing protein